MSALGSTLTGAGRESRRRMSEATERYGTLGSLPVHAINALLDPISTVSAAGTKVYDVLQDKQGEFLEQAETAVDQALREG